MKTSPNTNEYGNPIPQFLQHDSFLEFITSENVLRIVLGFVIGNVLSRFAQKIDIYGKVKEGTWSWKEFGETFLQFIMSIYFIYIFYRILIGFRIYSTKVSYQDFTKDKISKMKTHLKK